jgi:drug/metabolite transporter (DMT)-like permease
MLAVVLWTAIFSLVTVTSIILTGSRSLIDGDINFIRLLHILIDWRFLLGASFAFIARLSFIMINNALLKIPDLAASSTTITTFITSIAMVFVIIANYYFLGERISLTQGVGAFVILIGIFLITSN